LTWLLPVVVGGELQLELPAATISIVTVNTTNIPVLNRLVEVVL
jgi:hypothetical protein